MLLVTTPRFEPRSTGVRAIVAGLQLRADRGSNRGVVTSSIVALASI